MIFPRIFCKACGRSSGRYFRCPITNSCKLNLHPALDGSGIRHLSKHGYLGLFFRTIVPLQHGKVLPTSRHIDRTIFGLVGIIKLMVVGKGEPDLMVRLPAYLATRIMGQATRVPFMRKFVELLPSTLIPHRTRACCPWQVLRFRRACGESSRDSTMQAQRKAL